MNKDTLRKIEHEQRIISDVIDDKYLLRYITGELCAIRHILTDIADKYETTRLDKDRG